MHNWKLQNEWKVYHMTQSYDETIKLDADMLFTVDVNYYWEAMKARENLALLYVILSIHLEM